MSQIVTRKGPVGEDKDKRPTDSPVKEMKKKIAANAEKEKQAAEKSTDKPVHTEKKQDKVEKTDKTDKTTDKTSDKKEKSEKLDKSIDKKEKPEKLDKSIDKKEKPEKLDKSIDKKEKAEKSTEKKETEKKEQVVENKEKTADKKEKTSEKKEVEEKKDDSSKENSSKVDTDEKTKKPESKVKENGAKVNGEQNSDTVSSEDELQDLEVERDEMFPELAYEDSDGECFEPPTPEGLPSRSYTRRSQVTQYIGPSGKKWFLNVKSTRTPETPRPASEKNADKDYVPDDSKLLKLKEDIPLSDRKLRSSDSPKRQDRKSEKVQDTQSDSPSRVPVVVIEERVLEVVKEDDKEKKEEEEKETAETEEKIEVEIEVIEVENEDEGRSKAGTNYSKSRVKVSPYRRGPRADHTDTSLLANYTGNNTTMEMDITESSSFISDEPHFAESPYLSGLRSIRGRRSYKPLQEMILRNVAVSRSMRSNTSVNVSEQPLRPTGTVVGRKRKPSHEESELAEGTTRGKRARLLERLAKPFRTVSTPLPTRRAAEIVGINTDLPLSAPVADRGDFDPEAIKPPTLVDPRPPVEKDSKRCILM